MANNSGGWKFVRGDRQVFVYHDDVTKAIEVALKYLDGEPTGEAQVVSKSAFEGFFHVPPGSVIVGKVIREWSST